jgi:chromosome segregation ATPase
MKPIMFGLLIAAVALAAQPALAQGPPPAGDRDALIKKHVGECEVCAALQATVDKLQAELAQVHKDMEALRLKRLEDAIKALGEKYPDAKDALDQLLVLHKRIAEIEAELNETAAAGRDVLDELQLGPEDRAALVRALTPEQGPPGGGGPQFARTQEQRMRFARRGGDNPQMARRLEQMEAEHQRQLEELKKSDPEMYELTVKEEDLSKKLAEAQITLEDTATEHLRNAAQPH